MVESIMATFKKTTDPGVTNVSKAISIEAAGRVELTFSSKYLELFTKAAPWSSQVRLSVSDDIPLKVEFVSERGHIQYHLAPKIENDD